MANWQRGSLFLKGTKDKLANVYNVETDEIQILPENDMADPNSATYESRQLASVLVNGEVVAEGDQIPQDLKDYFKECEYASTNVRNYVSKAEENYNRENAINALKDDNFAIFGPGIVASQDGMTVVGLGNDNFYSNGDERPYSGYAGIRPVVILKSNINKDQIQKVTE